MFLNTMEEEGQRCIGVVSDLWGMTGKQIQPMAVEGVAGSWCRHGTTRAELRCPGRSG
jgi:hypothetical protein